MVRVGIRCRLALGEFSSRSESVIVVADSLDSDFWENLVAMGCSEALLSGGTWSVVSVHVLES